MGYRAATLLFDLLANEAAGQPQELFPATVQIRDSVAPAAS
jgi:DNA-binding LacI/PurR family transcriptional regulator